MMTMEDKERVQHVIGHTKLHDLFLYESEFTRGESFEGLSDKRPSGVLMEDMREVEAVQMPYFDGEEDNELLQIKVALGVRAIPDLETAEGKVSPSPLFTIQASFIVEYLTSAKLEDESIRVFANKNGVHNVWPFWRQHVDDVVNRGRMPRIVIPLFNTDR